MVKMTSLIVKLLLIAAFTLIVGTVFYLLLQGYLGASTPIVVGFLEILIYISLNFVFVYRNRSTVAV